MRRFLEAQPKDGRPIPAVRLRVLLTRDRDKARQLYRRFGSAAMNDGIPHPKGW